MKKIYTIICAFLFCAGAFVSTSAQVASPFTNKQLTKLRTPLSVPSIPHNSSRSATSIWLDYDSADAYVWADPAGESSSFIWEMTMSYNRAAGDSFDYQVKNIIVRFDSLYDVDSNNSIDRNTVTSITVDSIYAILGHSNFSGTDDTLIVKILNLNASRYPGTTTLWEDTTILSTSLSPNDNWLVARYLQWNPDYTNSMKGFAVQIAYYGDRQDTCGFIAGFHDHGACGSDPGPDMQILSNFYPNSFAYWEELPGIVPLNLFHATTNSLNDIWYDCTGNTAYEKGIDAENFLQNIRIGAWITVNNGVGLNEDLKNKGIGLYQNVPNPLHNTTSINYELANGAKDVTLTVFDIVGNKVMEVKEGNRTPGKYMISLDATKLAKGMYTYTLSADGSQLTKRMIVE